MVVMRETHRGIITDDTPRNEIQLKTVKNRLGQITLSLPRIDDGKRWAGYPGNAGIARQLARRIPACYYYIEPFAGTAKVAQELLKIKPSQRVMLNDKAKPIAIWLQKNFKTALVFGYDFADIVKQNNLHDNVFLFDPPWYKSYYDQVFSVFDRKNVEAYELELLKLCDTIKGKFFITTRKESSNMRNSKYRNFSLESEYKLCGKTPQVLVTTNTEPNNEMPDV